MARLEATPEDIRNFSRALKTYNDVLKSKMAGLKGDFNSVSSTWRDIQQQKFSAQFADLEKCIRRFLNTSVDYTKYLDQKVRKIQAYLGR